MIYTPNESIIKVFEGKNVRVVWNEEEEKYYFSIVDVVQILTASTDYQTARKYWKVLKGRLKKEGNESVTNCYQLKFALKNETVTNCNGLKKSAYWDMLQNVS